MTTAVHGKRIALAEEQYDRFHTTRVNQEPLTIETKAFWTNIGLSLPVILTPWSAVSVSYCVKNAGATSGKFKFVESLSVIVHPAIANAKGWKGFFGDLRQMPMRQGQGASSRTTTTIFYMPLLARRMSRILRLWWKSTEM